MRLQQYINENEVDILENLFEKLNYIKLYKGEDNIYYVEYALMHNKKVYYKEGNSLISLLKSIKI